LILMGMGLAGAIGMGGSQVTSALDRLFSVFNYGDKNSKARRMVEQKKDNDNVIKYGELEVHLDTHEVFVNNELVSISAKEFDILALLIKDTKRIYSVEQLYEAVWKENVLEGDSRTIIVYIGNIRKKIEPDPSNPKFILTVRGVGYKFNHNLEVNS
ncbi:MAG: response regulator transcription factor, partial [Clostridia bacterium]|nr:response regulator transcription factor [Clostridia bacterium]